MANENNADHTSDIIRGSVAIVIIIACAILVYSGKGDVSSLVSIISGITTYILGRFSNTPGSGQG